MRRIAIIILLILVGAQLALADSRSIHRIGAEGAFVDKTETPGFGQADQMLWRGSVEWQFTVAPTIFASCDIGEGIAGEYVIGSGTNAPNAGPNMIPFYGAGVPDWIHGSTNAFCDAGGDIFGGIEENAAISGATVRCWRAESAVPLWSYDIPGVGLPARTIRVSESGAVLVVAVISPTGGDHTKLYSFDVATGTLLSTFDCATNTFARALLISESGDLACVRSSATIYVVETATGAQRWTGSAGASASPLGFSADGEYIATGWTYLTIWRWNGTTYQFHWSNNAGAGWYMGCCAISADGSTIAAGWYTTSYNQNKLQLYDSSSGTPLWEHLDPPSGGAYQDLPVMMAMTFDGGYFVVGSWGDQLGQNDEIQIYSRESSEPVLTVDAPGSMFDCGIYPEAGGRGNVKVTAGGKHVHANQMGSGGDLFAIEIVTSAAGERLPERPRLTAWPNPFNPKVSLRYALAEAGSVDLAIYDVNGKRLRDLASGPRQAGEHELSWNGRDAAGTELASGVYLARLAGPWGVSSSRLVLLR